MLGGTVGEGRCILEGRSLFRELGILYYLENRSTLVLFARELWEDLKWEKLKRELRTTGSLAPIRASVEGRLGNFLAWLQVISYIISFSPSVSLGSSNWGPMHGSHSARSTCFRSVADWEFKITKRWLPSVCRTVSWLPKTRAKFCPSFLWFCKISRGFKVYFRG